MNHSPNRIIVAVAHSLVLTAICRLADAAPPKTAAASYAQLPLSFEQNRGQFDERIRFASRAGGYALLLASTEAVLSYPTGEGTRATLRMRLVGANSDAPAAGLEELPGKVNYLIGHDRTKWRRNVPTYARVAYRGVYPGIDLIFYGSQSQLEYDFVLSPGAEPAAITLAFEDAREVRLDSDGALVVEDRGSTLKMQSPRVYQMVDGERQEVAGRYVVRDRDRVGFEVAKYDRNKPLVIDPVLVFSTYLGGSQSEGHFVPGGKGIAVDAAGNSYIVGSTTSADFPTMNPLDGSYAGGICLGGVPCPDIFITKLNAAGTGLVYSTYLGGSNHDNGLAIAVDGTGAAYLTGWTLSIDFPISAGAFQNTLRSLADVFVTKIDPTGSAIIYSTYLGGGGDEMGTGIALDGSQNAYITGLTYSRDDPATPQNESFPLVNPAQPSIGGDINIPDAFVTKLNASGTGLIFSTYLGGSNAENDFFNGDIAVDPAGNAYVTGLTRSTNFPVTAGAYQIAFGGGASDAFITKYSAAGALVYSTYLGGNLVEVGWGIDVDSSGSAYVTGRTDSANFPILQAFQPNFAGGSDAFVTKLAPSGSTLSYSTFLGGSSGEEGISIAVDAAGSAHVTGITQSAGDFPFVNPIQPFGGAADAFVSKFNAAGSALVYSTPLGGNNNEFGEDIVVDSSGNAFVTGNTASLNYPTTPGAFQTANAGPDDAFVAKIAGDRADLALAKTDSPDPAPVQTNLTYTLTTVNNGPGTATGVTLTDTLPAGVVFVSVSTTKGSCSGAGPVVCNLGSLGNGANATVTIVVRPTSAGTIINTAAVTAGELDPVPGNNNASQATTVLPVADLSVSKTGRISVFYNVTTTNLGPSPATGVVITDTLPTEVTVLSIRPSQGTCGVSGRTVTCNIGNLATAATAVVEIIISARSGTMTNRARVTATELDTNTGNNAATVINRLTLEQ